MGEWWKRILSQLPPRDPLRPVSVWHRFLYFMQSLYYAPRQIAQRMSQMQRTPPKQGSPQYILLTWIRLFSKAKMQFQKKPSLESQNPHQKIDSGVENSESRQHQSNKETKSQKYFMKFSSLSQKLLHSSRDALKQFRERKERQTEREKNARIDTQKDFPMKVTWKERVMESLGVKEEQFIQLKESTKNKALYGQETIARFLGLKQTPPLTWWERVKLRLKKETTHKLYRILISIFWRVTLFFCVISFFLGLGKALPHEIRLYFQERSKKRENKEREEKKELLKEEVKN